MFIEEEDTPDQNNNLVSKQVLHTRTMREVEETKEETFEFIDDNNKKVVHTRTTHSVKITEETFVVIDENKDVSNIVTRTPENKAWNLGFSAAHTLFAWGIPLVQMLGIDVCPPLLFAKLGFTIYECSFWIGNLIEHQKILLLHADRLLEDKGSRNKLFNDALSIDFLKSCFIQQGSHDTVIKTILILYCHYGEIEAAKNILKAKQININDRINNKISLLDVVCQSGNEKLLEILLDHAWQYDDVLFPLSEHTPALLIAFRHHHQNIVNVLLKYGANPDVFYEGKTISHHAIEECNLKDKEQVNILVELLERSKLNTPDFTGEETPLEALLKKEIPDELLKYINNKNLLEHNILPIENCSPGQLEKVSSISDVGDNTNSLPHHASINPLLVGSFVAKETIESLPTIKSFLNIYHIDTSWLNYPSFWKGAHFIATYAGSISIGLFDPTKAFIINEIYIAKQDLKEKLFEAYQRDEHTAINSVSEFGEKCGSYLMKQAFLGGLITGGFDVITAYGAISNAFSSGVECYYLYNKPLAKQNDNSLTSQGAQYIIYPTMMYYSFQNADFSNNFNAMVSFKQIISTMTAIVVTDQLMGNFVSEEMSI